MPLRKPEVPVRVKSPGVEIRLPIVLRKLRAIPLKPSSLGYVQSLSAVKL
jgi:hypothetical protein